MAHVRDTEVHGGSTGAHVGDTGVHGGSTGAHWGTWGNIGDGTWAHGVVGELGYIVGVLGHMWVEYWCT